MTVPIFAHGFFATKTLRHEKIRHRETCNHGFHRFHGEKVNWLGRRETQRVFRRDNRIFLPRRGRRFSVSLVFSAKFTRKASFVTNYCLRPHSQTYWPIYEADLILIADSRPLPTKGQAARAQVTQIHFRIASCVSRIARSGQGGKTKIKG